MNFQIGVSVGAVALLLAFCAASGQMPSCVGREFAQLQHDIESTPFQYMDDDTRQEKVHQYLGSLKFAEQIGLRDDKLVRYLNDLQ